MEVARNSDTKAETKLIATETERREREGSGNIDGVRPVRVIWKRFDDQGYLFVTPRLTISQS